jgi:hypothetical protein
MRVHKLGSRLLRVVTPDGKVRYFTASGISSLRVFWIFRNFSSLDARILSRRQLELIKKVCRAGEARKGAIDLADLVGTLELSTSGAQDWCAAPKVHLVQPVVVQAPATEDQPARMHPSFALSATVLASSLLLLAVLLMNHHVRLQFTSFISGVSKFAESLRPHVPQLPNIHASSEKQIAKHQPLQPTVLKLVSSVAEGARSEWAQSIPAADKRSIGSIYGEHALQSGPERTNSWALSEATLPVANGRFKPSSIGSRTVPPERLSTSLVTANVDQTQAITNSSPHYAAFRKQPLEATLAASPELLPPSPPPRTHPVPDSFSSVSRDTHLLLRAIVSPEGAVTRVSVLEGDSRLAREAVRAVMSWRYTPRSATGDTESRIMFRIMAPDVITVSFPDSDIQTVRR